MVQLLSFHFFRRKNCTVPSGAKFSPIFPGKRKAPFIRSPSKLRAILVISVPDLTVADRAIYRVRVLKIQGGDHKTQYTRDKGNLILYSCSKRMWGLPVIERGTSCFDQNTEKRSKLKSTKKRNFLALKDMVLTSPSCCLTLASSLDVVQVRFAFWRVYRLLLGNDLPNL